MFYWNVICEWRNKESKKEKRQQVLGIIARLNREVSAQADVSPNLCRITRF
jgi:hypothetical protein